MSTEHNMVTMVSNSFYHIVCNMIWNMVFLHYTWLWYLNRCTYSSTLAVFKWKQHPSKTKTSIDNDQYNTQRGTYIYKHKHINVILELLQRLPLEA